MTYAARRIGLTVAVAVGAALALGVALALAQGESVLLWFAYMLDIAGGLAIAFAIFSGAPTSARKAIVQRFLEKKDETNEVATHGGTIVSDLLLFVAAGILLLALGLVVELAAT